MTSKMDSKIRSNYIPVLPSPIYRLMVLKQAMYDAYPKIVKDVDASRVMKWEQELEAIINLMRQENLDKNLNAMLDSSSTPT